MKHGGKTPKGIAKPDRLPCLGCFAHVIESMFTLKRVRRVGKIT
jgi:hypothetical protein